MSKKDYQAIARAIYAAREDMLPRDSTAEDVRMFIASELADVLAADNPRFDRARFVEACETGACKGMRKPYQPKTGARCACRPGIERDNCPNCEGTGLVVDFAAIRARTQKGV